MLQNTVIFLFKATFCYWVFFIHYVLMSTSSLKMHKHVLYSLSVNHAKWFFYLLHRTNAGIKTVGCTQAVVDVLWNDRSLLHVLHHHASQLPPFWRESLLMTCVMLNFDKRSEKMHHSIYYSAAKYIHILVYSRENKLDFLLIISAGWSSTNLYFCALRCIIIWQSKHLISC